MRLLPTLSFGLVLLAGGCYPGGAEFVDELDVVFTDFDDNYDFGSQASFHLVDSIYVARDPGDPILPSSTRNAILTTIRTNMTSRGYTSLPDTVGADMVLLVTVNLTDKTFTTLFPVCCWGAPGWGWGWGAGWVPVSQSYTTGAILVQMVDPETFDYANQLYLVHWLGAGYGINSGSQTFVDNRIRRAINQMFTQSPYFTRN
jgi:hypothetical protein